MNEEEENRRTKHTLLIAIKFDLELRLMIKLKTSGRNKKVNSSKMYHVVATDFLYFAKSMAVQPKFCSVSFA